MIEKDRDCPTTFAETVCVGAKIKIVPEVGIGEIKTICLGEPVFVPEHENFCPECIFHVCQRIRIQIPLVFGADVCVDPTGIVCDKPEFEHCEHD